MTLLRRSNVEIMAFLLYREFFAFLIIAPAGEAGRRSGQPQGCLSIDSLLFGVPSVPLVLWQGRVLARRQDSQSVAGLGKIKQPRPFCLCQNEFDIETPVP
jgi:hypothetical protein